MTPIQRLFAGRGPSAITRFIVPVVIDAVERAPARRVAHVGIEVREAIPSLAHGNAAPSIMWIVPSIGVGAALFHARPNLIYARVTLAMSGCRQGALAVAGYSHFFLAIHTTAGRFDLVSRRIPE